MERSEVYQNTDFYKNEGKRKKSRYVKYVEAGLALLLLAGIGLSGRTGLLARESLQNQRALSESGQTDLLQSESSHPETIQPDGGQSDASKLGGGQSDAALSNTSQTGASSGLEDSEGEYYGIMGESTVTVQEMADYFQASGRTYPAEELTAGGADSIEAFCQIYYEEAAAEGVKAEVAFAQTMKETGFLQYGGDASIEQYNFAGIGTTGNGVPGNSYPDVRTGIRAQIQHLKAYASTDPLEQDCVDDRYELVRKGSAPYVEWLGQQENPEGAGWATGENYGYDIVGMIRDMT